MGLHKVLNKLVTEEKFVDKSEECYLYASISTPPLKIVSKNGSENSMDYTVQCPTCGSLRNYGTEIYMLNGDHYCETIGCRERCISHG